MEIERVERRGARRHDNRHEQPLLKQRLRVHLPHLAEGTAQHAEDVVDGFVHQVASVQIVELAIVGFELEDVPARR